MALPGEDQTGFRARAERSMLADMVKDKGACSMFPPLSVKWLEQVNDQKDWKKLEKRDFERLREKYGISWIVVEQPVVGLGLPVRELGSSGLPRQLSDIRFVPRRRRRKFAFVVGFRPILKSLSLITEDRVVHHTGSLKRKLQSGSQNLEPIANASAEVDGGGFFEIFGRTRYLADMKTEVDALGEHLVVEDEIVAVFSEVADGSIHRD